MTYLRFRNDLVPDVLDGSKWLTARYLLERGIEPGDVVSAVDEDDNVFAEIDIVHTTAVPAARFVELVDLIGGHRTYDGYEELRAELEECYDLHAGFGPAYPLRVLFFRKVATVIGLAELNELEEVSA